MTFDEKKEVIKDIDMKLDILGQFMENTEYDDFIHSNEALACYSKVHFNIEIGNYPPSIKLMTPYIVLKTINQMIVIQFAKCIKNNEIVIN